MGISDFASPQVFLVIVFFTLFTPTGVLYHTYFCVFEFVLCLYMYPFKGIMSENVVMWKIAHFCTFLCVNQTQTYKCENRAFPAEIMRDFII